MTGTLPSRVRVRLAPGKERAVRQGHPWVFSRAIADVRPDDQRDLPGLAIVEDSAGQALGTGFWSPRSQIRVRLAAAPDVPIDRAFFARRLAAARALRAALLDGATTGYRLLNAEGDGVPGWTVDVLGSALVSQVTCAGLESVRDDAYAALVDLLPDASIRQANDLPARRLEGLALDDETVRGAPAGEVEFHERGLRFGADLRSGQKTGFYFDQRDNRRRVEELARGRRVLDLFAHTGAFGVGARRGGCQSVLHVESSAPAIERGRRHYALNQLDDGHVDWIKADVFEWLRRERDGGRFDLVVCDPPPLARRRSDLERAARAYKDVNRLAMRAVAPGGFLFTFSCSGAVDAKLFRQILHAAAAEAGRPARLLAPLGAAPDHPVSIHHLEGEYLKGWLLAL